MNKRKLFLAFSYIYTSWLILQIFLTKFGLDSLEKANFFDSIAAVAYRPFVYRALIPAIIRSTADLIPTRPAYFIDTPLYQTEILTAHATAWSLQYVLFALLTWGCFIGFAYCMRWLTRYFYPTYSLHVTDLAVPLIALLVIPLFFRHFNFVYDPATILLFPLALVCLLQERYLLFVLILALCALNKETSVLLIPAFLVYARQRGLKLLPTSALAILQLIICLGIYKYITYSMADRPGVPMEIQLFKYNLLLPIRQPYSFTWLVCIIGGFTYFVSQEWKTKPPFLRHTLVFMLLPHTAMLVVVGCLDELRVFYEVYAITVLLMVPTAIKFLQTCLGEVSEAENQ